MSENAIADRLRWQAEGWLASVGRGNPGRGGVGGTAGGGSAVGRGSTGEDADDPGPDPEDFSEEGITALGLTAAELTTPIGATRGLFDENTGQITHTLERLQGLFGPDSVLVPGLQGGWDPAETNLWTPWRDGVPDPQPAGAVAGFLGAPRPTTVDHVAVDVFSAGEDRSTPVRPGSRGLPARSGSPPAPPRRSSTSPDRGPSNPGGGIPSGRRTGPVCRSSPSPGVRRAEQGVRPVVSHRGVPLMGFNNPRTPWSELARRLEGRTASKGTPAGTAPEGTPESPAADAPAGNRAGSNTRPVDRHADGSDAPAFSRPDRYPVSVGPRGPDSISRYPGSSAPAPRSDPPALAHPPVGGAACALPVQLPRRGLRP